MTTHRSWTLAAVVVAGAAIVSVQQTGALWSDSAQSAGSTITAGRLDIAVGDSNSQVKAYQFTALTASNMVSGDSVQRPLHVRNAGNVPMKYKVDSATLSGVLPLKLQVTAVSSEVACPASGDASGDPLYSGDLTGAETSYRELAKGTSEILCFRVTMGPNATAGNSGAATFTFGTTQS